MFKDKKLKINKEDLKKSKIKRFLFIGLGIIYILSPIDFIPEIIPILGVTDDLLVLLALVYKVFDTGNKGINMFDVARGKKVSKEDKSKINESNVVDGEIVDE